MATEYVTIEGMDTVLRHLNKLADPVKTLDGAIRRTAALSRGDLARATLSRRPESQSFKFGSIEVKADNLKTGDLARGWTAPIKIADGYMIENAKKAGNKSMADIMDKGRQALSKTVGAFYIPLTRKGQNKPPGAKPEGLKFGVDYIMTKKIKAFPGYHYLKEIKDKSAKYLLAEIHKEIERVYQL